MLKITHLSKRYGSLQALDSLSFDVGAHELVGFVGANGAGKSPTMRIIMGVLEGDGGTVTWDGAPVDAAARRRIGYMPEERGLYPKMKVGDQLTYLARLHGADRAGAERATRVHLLTGSTPAAQRRRILAELAAGEPAIVVGTHALLSDTVQIPFLGLVVVDEQHRFGVAQRDALRERGGLTDPATGQTHTPHLLVMTATPIPRTIAMTVFGDLATSVLDELPAGRSTVPTHLVPWSRTSLVEGIWRRAAKEVASGVRVYVVCPRI